jgi:DNA primase
MRQDLPVSFTPPQDRDVKEQIRQATDIVDLIGAYLPLRRQGRNYVTRCPWHDDTRPSLQVNQERQTWKCWVCDDGGDIFNFVMKQERVDFREALQILADRAGIPLRAAQAQYAPGSPQDKRTLYKAMQWAEQQYHQCLLHDAEAEAARRYVRQRGISWESVERFRLGFVPDGWQWLLDRCRSAGFSAQVLEAVGLSAKSDRSDRYYDRFRNRVMFPIHDAQGRTIACGGRILPEAADDKTAKYINSPETKLYSKSNQLYALDLARDSIVKRREIVVVEGYTDVIMAHQAGVDHVVAVCGTALGPGHLRLLRRFADTTRLVLDGDEAGQRRTNEILELFITAQTDLRVLTLPQGLDPCDYLSQQGADAFRQLLDTAVDALEHKTRVATRGIDLVRDTHRANLALEDILSTIARAPRQTDGGNSAELRLREQQLLARLARQFSLPEHEIRSRLNDLRRRGGSQRPASPDPAADQQQQRPALSLRGAAPREIELLEILLLHPELVERAIREIELSQLTSEAVKQLYHMIQMVHSTGRTPDFGNVLTEMEDPQLKNIWVELDDRAQAKSAAAHLDAPARLQGLIDDFHYAMLTRDRQQTLVALEEKRLDDQQEQAVLEALIAQERNRRGISAPTDG